jgi:hypothetical protein
VNDLPPPSVLDGTARGPSGAHPEHFMVGIDSINNGHHIYFQDTMALANQIHYDSRVIWEAPEINLHDNTKDGYKLSPAWTVIHTETKPQSYISHKFHT